MPEPISSSSLLETSLDGKTMVLREGLARLFPADSSASFDDLLRAIDRAEERQREALP